MIESVGAILRQQMSSSPMARQVTAALVVEFANELVKELWGQKTQGQLRAVSLRGQSLKFACQNAVVGQELNFKKNKIMAAINDKFKKSMVKNIKIVPGNL